MKIRTVGFWVILAVLATPVAWAQPAPPVEQGGGKPRGPEEGRTGIIITAPSNAQEKTVDEGGKIYTERGYKGVVPNLRDASAVPAKDPSKQATAAAGKAVVDWVGFQPFPTYSRVFIQVSGKYTFSVIRPSPTIIEIRFGDALVSTENDLNELVTRAFPTQVDKVVTRTTDDGAVVVDVHLKKPAGYLYRQDGKYVYVDVEK